MSWNASYTGSSASYGAFSQPIFVTFEQRAAPEPPPDPGYLPPRGALIMRARRLADGSWYVPGYKQRSLALGAGRG